MPYDISEIKKLPTEEKLQIIDELWESIEGERADDEDAEEASEVINLLNERIEKYERGEGKWYSFDEAKQLLLAPLAESRDS